MIRFSLRQLVVVAALAGAALCLALSLTSQPSVGEAVGVREPGLIADRLPDQHNIRAIPTTPPPRDSSAEVIATAAELPLAIAATSMLADDAYDITSISGGGYTFKFTAPSEELLLDLLDAPLAIKGTGKADGVSLVAKGDKEVPPIALQAGSNAEKEWKVDSFALGPGRYTLEIKKGEKNVGKQPSWKIRVPDPNDPPRPVITGVANGVHAKVVAPPAPTPFNVYGVAPYLRLEGRSFDKMARLQFFWVDKDGVLRDRIEPKDGTFQYGPGPQGDWSAEFVLPDPLNPSTPIGHDGTAGLVLLSQSDKGHNRSAFASRLLMRVQPSALVQDVNVQVTQLEGRSALNPDPTTKVYRANTVELKLAASGTAPAGTQLVVYRAGDSRPAGALDIGGQSPADGWKVPLAGLKEGLQQLHVVVEQGDQKVKDVANVSVDIQTHGPRVRGTEPANFGTMHGQTSLTIVFSTENPLKITDNKIVNGTSVQTFFLWASKGTGVFPGGTQINQSGDAIYDPNRNAVTLRFAADKISPDIYSLEIVGTGIEDIYGNKLEGVEGQRGTNYVKTLGAVSPQGAPGELVPLEVLQTRGVRDTTGPYVEFPEYTKPRKPTNGFNPSDHVETRVARLYYYRDAHRVAQILNRDVKSYNRAAVDVAAQLADKARADADAATDTRRKQEFLAVEAAKETRRAEHDLESAQRTLNQAAQNNVEGDRLLPMYRQELANVPNDTTLTTPEKKADKTRELEANIAKLEANKEDRSAVVQAAAERVRAASAAVEALRRKETQSNEAVLDSQAKEDRSREEQFRREVAAAHADPDTYVPGKIESIDPVRQVSISVIGEGLIQLRGPIKGVNIIRLMIDQIDAPVGQVRVGVHTVQINGEHGDKMEVVADRIQKYIDHSRFLTLQSAEILRKAVAKVAAIKASECEGAVIGDTHGATMPCLSQDERDRRYLYSFFGRDFTCELEAMDSEFLKTGNKLLSFHSMDTTSLASALFVLSLAKNSVRAQILEEFQSMVACELPEAEINYFVAGYTAPRKKIQQWCDKERFQLLACNAKFQSTRGMFNAEILGDDTISPIQREFIRLAQIFKSRLIVEMQLKQRVMERAVIEERLGNRIQELRKAKAKDELAKTMLEDTQQLTTKQRGNVLNSVTQVLASVPRIGPALREALDRYRRDFSPAAIQRIKTIGLRKAGAPIQLEETITFAGKSIPLAPWTDSTGKVYVRPRRNTDAEREWTQRVTEAVESAERIRDELNKFYRSKNEGRAQRLQKANTDLAEIAARYKLDLLEGKLSTDTLGNLDGVMETYESLIRIIDQTIGDLSLQLSQLIRDLSEGETDIVRAFRDWTRLRKDMDRLLERSPDPEFLADANRKLDAADTSFRELLVANTELQFAQQNAQVSRQPLDHKKFLDLLIDEMEDKYIELLEGTRAHTANIDAYIKRLVTCVDDDFNTQFYHPAFRQVRSAGRARDVTLGQIEYTSILANNREFAKVSPQATMEFDLPKRDILITEAMKGAKGMMDEYGALLQDPTFLALSKLKSGQSTASPPKSVGQDFSTVRNVLPGLPGSSGEKIVSQADPGSPEIGAALESLIPDPAIYKFETGTGYEIRPVIQPDGQAVVFHFNYMYTTNVREPVRADEKHLGRVKRHFIDTDVQLSNYELREVSRYTVALKASRTSRGVPLFENIPLAGALFRPMPSAESSLQQNIILGQATIFPTLFDLMGLRWAPAVADLDPLRVTNDEFVVRGRNRALMNRVFDHSSSEVDRFLRIPEAERRTDLYRSQESIPVEHPNGYRGPGLNLRDSNLQEGYSPQNHRPPSQFVPGTSKEAAASGPFIEEPETTPMENIPAPRPLAPDPSNSSPPAQPGNAPADPDGEAGRPSSRRRPAVMPTAYQAEMPPVRIAREQPARNPDRWDGLAEPNPLRGNEQEDQP